MPHKRKGNHQEEIYGKIRAHNPACAQVECIVSIHIGGLSRHTAESVGIVRSLDERQYSITPGIPWT